MKMSENNNKKIEFTPSQKKAIGLRGHSMLISAAAGSGKTAVLTRRIIELITDTNNPVDVSDLLVVTFTRAAANELRIRISDAIYAALKDDPLNRHLSNQLVNLGKAKICTIHSFCSTLIKGNFQYLGLPATTRIADESESALICNNVMTALIDECYEGMHSDRISDFVDFTEQLIEGKTDDGIGLSLIEIYNSLRAFPKGIDLLLDFEEAFECASSADVFDSRWGEYLKDYLTRIFEYYYEKCKSACEYFESDELFVKKYLPTFEYLTRKTFSGLEALKVGSYNDLMNIVDISDKVGLGRQKEESKTKETIYYLDIRAKLEKELENIKSRLLAFSEVNVKKHFAQNGSFCRNAYEFLKLFDAEFEKEKKKRGLLDYSDLERYTIRLLYSDADCTQTTEFANTVKGYFKYVFIDEYQDVNELQDKIFSAISTDNNRFMVGDIKQSIYGFRGAEPQIFSDYRNKFPEYNEECPDSDGVTLYLSDNFRSDRSVIRFCNAVFGVLFNNNSGSVPYTSGDELVCSKIYKEGEQDYEVKIRLADNIEKSMASEIEAEYVAGEVEKLIREGTEPSDIVLLFRTKSKTSIFEEALKKRNIKCFNKEDKDFFENDAVLLMLCILNTVDNPTRDIYLAGALKSPIFGFTVDDLTLIKSYAPKKSLYDSLLEYSDANNDKKSEYFFKKLNEWRRFSEGRPVDALIRKIYRDTHIVEMLAGRKNSDSDIERHANLLLLYEYARDFENGSFKGLYNFILYLNDVLEKKTKLANAQLTGEGKGVVSIMTIHNSKGLEFNTVFLCDTSHGFNRADQKKVYNLHKKYGLTVKLRDETYFGRINTLAKKVGDLCLQEESLEEELRVLYVALTRAKKRLVITSSLPKAKELVEYIKSDLSEVSRYVLTSSKNLIELLLWGILKSGYNDYSLDYYTLPENDTGSDEGKIETYVEPVYDEEAVKSFELLIKEKMAYEYPYGELTVLPSKLAVSKLYPEVLDEFSSEIETSAPSMYACPKFVIPEETRATAAEKGIATHTFMQFCDFENVVRNGVDAELKRLTDRCFLDKRNAELVNKKEISTFFESSFYASLSKAQKIWRERRFNMKLPAVYFTKDEDMQKRLSGESVLVQGVIDLLYLDADGRLVLADYKTDRFTRQQIASGEAEDILRERHSTQLTYYSEACKRLLGRDVDKIYVYSFCLGREVLIK